MDLLADKLRFYEQVAPSRPNEWEVDEIFDRLADLDTRLRRALLSHVPAIWPVSHSLCFTFLEEGGAALVLFPEELLEEWVRQILGLYERKGLVGAREFMAGVDTYFLGPRRGEAGVHLAEISTRMLLYIQGVSGLQLKFDTAPLPLTDTETIFLPEFLTVFTEKEKNFLLYKILISLQWGQIVSGVFTDWRKGADAERPFAVYPDQGLATDLFAALQFVKVYRLLMRELPGVVRQTRELCYRLIMAIQPEGKAKDQSAALCGLLLQGFSRQEQKDAPGEGSSFEALPSLYERIAPLPGGYSLGGAALLLGTFDFRRTGEVQKRRREEEKKKFIALFAALLQGKNGKEPAAETSWHHEKSEDSDTLMLLKVLHTELKKPIQAASLSAMQDREIPQELQSLASDIIKDLGSIPDTYLQAAVGLAGDGLNRQESQAVEGDTQLFQRLVPKFIYDEWDYRRGGFRQDWCSLYERTLTPVVSSFVAVTLEKYHRERKRLIRQFTMLRPSRRVVRRRRHGDDIDLDALIEALCDSRAGLALRIGCLPDHCG